jgi:retinol-binding protein 3
MNHFLKLFCVTGLTLLCFKAKSQADTVRLKMIQSLTKYIKSHYVSADIAKKMCDTISWKFSNKKYDPALNLDEFAFEITKDLRRISNDKHISVTRPIYKPFDEEAYNSKFDRMTDKQRKKYYVKSQKEWQKFKAEYKKRTMDDMFTYGEVKILPGNIGYVEVKDFGSTSYDKRQNKGRISIESVMRFLKNTNSIIIDLRDNQGGFIKQAAKFCSYFSPKTSNYFITTEWHFRYDSSGIEKEMSDVNKILTSDRIDNSLTNSKTIYILTSQRTFSAAELSTYKIKRFNPATTVVGEKTKGGGNGHSGGTTDKYFTAIIPYLKAYDENNSNYNLEAKGITPDNVTLSDSSLAIAYKLALKETVPTGTKVRYLKKQNAPINAGLNNFQKFYPDYLGDFRKIQIIKEGDSLFMLYDTFNKILLLPETIDYFTGNIIQYVKFLRDNNGRVTSIQIRHTNEFMEEFRRQ